MHAAARPRKSLREEDPKIHYPVSINTMAECQTFLDNDSAAHPRTISYKQPKKAARLLPLIGRPTGALTYTCTRSAFLVDVTCRSSNSGAPVWNAVRTRQPCRTADSARSSTALLCRRQRSHRPGHKVQGWL